MCDNQEYYKIPQQYQQYDNSSEFKTPLQRLQLRMREKFIEGTSPQSDGSDQIVHRQIIIKNNDKIIENNDNDDYQDDLIDDNQGQLNQSPFDQQPKGIQKHSDKIIEQLFALQRSSVLNAQYQQYQQQQQSQNFHRVNLNNENYSLFNNQIQQTTEDTFRQKVPSSYLYSCVVPQDQIIYSSKFQENITDTNDPWWKPQNSSNENTIEDIESIDKFNSRMNQIYPVALRLFCEKFNKLYNSRLVGIKGDNKKLGKKVLKKNKKKKSKLDTVYGCEIEFEGVKCGVTHGKTKREAKDLAAKKVIQQLIENGDDKQKQFLEKYLKSANYYINQRYSGLIMQPEQRQRQLEQEKQQQLLEIDITKEEIDENSNFTMELSLFAHKTLRKPVSWETIYQIYSKSWLAMVYVGKLTETGYGNSKKSAKNVASLKLLRRCKKLNMKENIIENISKPNVTAEVDNKDELKVCNKAITEERAKETLQRQRDRKMLKKALKLQKARSKAMKQSSVVEKPSGYSNQQIPNQPVQRLNQNVINTTDNIKNMIPHQNPQSFKHEYGLHQNNIFGFYKNQYDFMKKPNIFSSMNQQNHNQTSFGFKNNTNYNNLKFDYSIPNCIPRVNQQFTNNYQQSFKSDTLNHTNNSALRNINSNQMININRFNTVFPKPPPQWIGKTNNGQMSYVHRNQNSILDQSSWAMNGNYFDKREGKVEDNKGKVFSYQSTNWKPAYHEFQNNNYAQKHFQGNYYQKQYRNYEENSQNKENQNPNEMSSNQIKLNQLQNLKKEMNDNYNNNMINRKRNLEMCSWARKDEGRNDDDDEEEEGEIIDKKRKIEDVALSKK